MTCETSPDLKPRATQKPTVLLIRFIFVFNLRIQFCSREKKLIVKALWLLYYSLFPSWKLTFLLIALKRYCLPLSTILLAFYRICIILHSINSVTFVLINLYLVLEENKTGLFKSQKQHFYLAVLQCNSNVSSSRFTLTWYLSSFFESCGTGEGFQCSHLCAISTTHASPVRRVFFALEDDRTGFERGHGVIKTGNTTLLTCT